LFGANLLSVAAAPLAHAGMPPRPSSKLVASESSAGNTGALSIIEAVSARAMLVPGRKLSPGRLSVVIDSFRIDDLPHLDRLITGEGLMPISMESEDGLRKLLNSLTERRYSLIHDRT